MDKSVILCNPLLLIVNQPGPVFILVSGTSPSNFDSPVQNAAVQSTCKSIFHQKVRRFTNNYLDLIYPSDYTLWCDSNIGDPLHSVTACAQPCNANAHSLVPREQ